MDRAGITRVSISGGSLSCAKQRRRRNYLARVCREPRAWTSKNGAAKEQNRQSERETASGEKDREKGFSGVVETADGGQRKCRQRG